MSENGSATYEDPAGAFKAARENVPLPKVNYLEFDFSQPAPPPEWLWEGILEEGTITVISGVKSAIKTLLGNGLTAACIRGDEEFLGRRVDGTRVLVIDAENPKSVPHARLYSLGVGDEHLVNLRYVGLPGNSDEEVPSIGSDRWNRWLAHVVIEFAPDLILIDGSLSATDVSDINDAEAVKRLFGGLRAAIAGHRTAVVMYHHERKPDPRQGRGDADHAAIGTVYWLNLADTGYALANPRREVEETDDGKVLRTAVRFEVTKPPRAAVPPDPGWIAAEGHFDHDGRLLQTTFALTVDPGARKLHDAILAHGGPMSSGALAKAVAMDVKNSTYDRNRRAALDAGLIVKTETYGEYDVPRGPDSQSQEIEGRVEVSIT